MTTCSLVLHIFVKLHCSLIASLLFVKCKILVVHIVIVVCYYLYLSHAGLPANNNPWGVIIVTLLSIACMGPRIRFMAASYHCQPCRSFRNPSAIWWHPPRIAVNDPSNCGMAGQHLGCQAHKRRSNRHRRRNQQSTSSVYRNPSDLSANRRRAEDDENGHLIYHDGDILHSRCTQSFVYLFIRRWLWIIVLDIWGTQFFKLQ